MKNDAIIIGQHELAVERFRDDTRHMIIFDMLNRLSPMGNNGERPWLSLTDEAYARARAAQDQGYIRIKKIHRRRRGVYPTQQKEKAAALTSE